VDTEIIELVQFYDYYPAGEEYDLLEMNQAAEYEEEFDVFDFLF